MVFAFTSRKLVTLLGLSSVAQASPLAGKRDGNGIGPCADAAAAEQSFISAYGSVMKPHIPARVAYACLKTVPFHKENATALVTSLMPYVEVQSTIDYLKNPPKGYLYDAVDIPSELKAIQAKINNNEYHSEYDFQIDLYAVTTMAKDGHFAFVGDVVSLFSWVRPQIYLVAVSEDGKAVPKIYNLRELFILDILLDEVTNTVLVDTITIGETTVTPNSLKSVSPISQINGIDVVTFLRTQAYADSHQDPDAGFNAQLFSIQKATFSTGSFNEPKFYPGDSTTYTYANGSTQTVTNQAVVALSFTGIASGADVYQKYCSGQLTQTNSTTDEPIQGLKFLNKRQAQSSQSVTQLDFYPKPVAIDTTGTVSGYFLSGAGYEDVAVLAIYGFMPRSGKVDDAWIDGFQSTVQTFLAAAGKAGKKKLILDVQGNGGGVIDLSLDTYMQLFPKSAGPNTKNNLRYSVGMNLIIEAASGYVDENEHQGAKAEALAEFSMIPFGYQTVMSPETKAFPDAKTYAGPYQTSHGSFTAYMQPNWTNDQATDFGVPGITITGTNDRLGFPQYFDPENVVILSDGFCGSACTIISEILKSDQRTRSFTIGGRPQNGPMQSSGGVKGSQLFPPQSYINMVELINILPTAEQATLQGTVWNNFNTLPVARSKGRVQSNGRNAYRIGDQTETALQFVYEASDCRMYTDISMVTDPTAIWKKVAKAAFSKAGQIDESYCVQGSTKHPTSITGGLARGEIGPQTPPQGAQAGSGWLVNGTTIVTGSGVGAFSGAPRGKITNNLGGGQKGTTDLKALANLQTACTGYAGNSWFVSLICSNI